MGVRWVMPNGEEIPVPQDIVSQGPAAEQAFYDNQVARIAAEGKSAARPTESDA